MRPAATTARERTSQRNALAQTRNTERNASTAKRRHTRLGHTIAFYDNRQANALRISLQIGQDYTQLDPHLFLYILVLHKTRLQVY
jgi:hypothetical protein